MAGMRRRRWRRSERWSSAGWQRDRRRTCDARLRLVSRSSPPSSVELHEFSRSLLSSGYRPSTACISPTSDRVLFVYLLPNKDPMVSATGTAPLIGPSSVCSPKVNSACGFLVTVREARMRTTPRSSLESLFPFRCSFMSEHMMLAADPAEVTHLGKNVPAVAVIMQERRHRDRHHSAAGSAH